MPRKDVETTPTPPFETALAELEKLVEQMERGDVSLDESLRLFERGVELARHCQTALRDAETKIQVLMERNGQHVLDELASDESQE